MNGTKVRTTMLDRAHVFAMRAKWERVALASIRQGFQDELEAVRAGGPAAIDPFLWQPILYAMWKGAAYDSHQYATARIIAGMKTLEKVEPQHDLDTELLGIVALLAASLADYNYDALLGLPADDIEDLYDQWTGGRSATLARTFAVGAVALGQTRAAQAFPLEKTWHAVGDAATRPTHLTANGQTIPVADMYIVGGARLEYPGDPSGPAAEVANCRCWENYTKVG